MLLLSILMYTLTNLRFLQVFHFARICRFHVNPISSWNYWLHFVGRHHFYMYSPKWDNFRCWLMLGSAKIFSFFLLWWSISPVSQNYECHVPVRNLHHLHWTWFAYWSRTCITVFGWRAVTSLFLVYCYCVVGPRLDGQIAYWDGVWLA